MLGIAPLSLEVMMLIYFGTSFLTAVLAYYAGRLAQAVDGGYDQAGSKFHWLYAELSERVGVLQMTKLFLEAIPKFLMEQDGSDKAFSYVVTYIHKWFPDSLFGQGPGEGSDSFFTEDNPYWTDFTAMDAVFGVDYDLEQKPQLYIDLCEYTVRALRLYFQIRERRFQAIDRNQFDAVMGMQMALHVPG